jgi:hypothetical protein
MKLSKCSRKSLYQMRGDAHGRSGDNFLSAAVRSCYSIGMDVREAGRLGALATNNKLSKKKRRESARRAARARWDAKK